MLHILNKPPYSDSALQMLNALSSGDAVVLIEDGVQAAFYPEWQGWLVSTVSIYLLAEDAISRGVHTIAAIHEMPLIEVDGFVALTEQNEQIISWH
ncbi:sulfurtransferase complex subunit TusB [Halomonas qinghailakensis]|uniref:Sulfurtransferase complex subunit TusB n=1 Tax=Halomonas qinghailakensis TaxID=2937790 RepID=A0AA46TQF7_9GAMM|nr:MULTISPECIES: sulfurtransferase complex subunit TusB [Halomonas]UYO74457.1 sulfurtransferase complex subunit TusB [Halomonas sp. ZZQ-149]